MSLKRFLLNLITFENVLALLLALIVIAVIIMTADTAPQWIYQGF
jgi:hypothetical protein